MYICISGNINRSVLFLPKLPKSIRSRCSYLHEISKFPSRLFPPDCSLNFTSLRQHPSPIRACFSCRFLFLLCLIGIIKLALWFQRNINVAIQHTRSYSLDLQSNFLRLTEHLEPVIYILTLLHESGLFLSK